MPTPYGLFEWLWLQGSAAPLAPLLQRLAPSFFPYADAHSSRDKKHVSAPSFAALRPFGCSGAKPLPVTSHRGRDGRGLEASKENIMANIGSFTKTGETYKGEIVTMSVQTKNVRIVPEDARDNENAPTHRVFVGRAEIGAAWAKTSNEGRAYLSVKLDDPSFTAPLFANLFDDEDGKTFNLIWSRARRSNGE